MYALIMESSKMLCKTVEGVRTKLNQLNGTEKIVLQQKNNFHRRSEGGSCEKNLMLHETWVEIIK